MKLADKILKLRKQQGMSQEELAEKLNISRQTISRWENGSAQPDAINILQLSKLFGVTADFLINDDYESDHDVLIVKNTEKTTNEKIKKIVGLCTTVAGILGNLTIYVLSRMVEVMVPIITYDETGQKWYRWSSEQKDYSYKYFIQEHNLESLTAIFWLLVIAGVVVAFVKKGRVDNFIFSIKNKFYLGKNQQDK